MKIMARSGTGDLYVSKISMIVPKAIIANIAMPIDITVRFLPGSLDLAPHITINKRETNE
jgi:hypothetical protein